MSEYKYLSGLKELFNDAPDDARVVLEHDDGRIFYAVEYESGARYWNADGSPGSKLGLIALLRTTRVVARRATSTVKMDREPADMAAFPTKKVSPRMQKAMESIPSFIKHPDPIADRTKSSPGAVDPKPATPLNPPAKITVKAESVSFEAESVTLNGDIPTRKEISRPLYAHAPVITVKVADKAASSRITPDSIVLVEGLLAPRRVVFIHIDEAVILGNDDKLQVIESARLRPLPDKPINDLSLILKNNSDASFRELAALIYSGVYQGMVSGLAAQ